MNRMSMAQQLNEQIDGESILDGILGEVANSKSAFSGVGAEVAADSLAESKRATDESRAKGLVAKKNASKAVEAAFTNPDASDARDIFAIMKADETNNKAELDADREARIIKARAVAPVEVGNRESLIADSKKVARQNLARKGIEDNKNRVRSEEDQTFLEGGGLSPLQKQANPDDINSAVQEAQEYEGGATSGAGLMSKEPASRPFTALEIEQAAEMGVTISNKNGLPADENGDIVKANAFTDFFKNLFGLNGEGSSGSDPINVRNNNLGNIKNVSSNNWQGQTNLKTKETFASFSSPELGVRALKKVIQANINATSTIEEYVNRYASEPKEKAYFKKTGSLMPHLKNYALIIAKSQGLDSEKAKLPKKANMLEWIKATAKAEGGAGALSYFTDDVINAGIKL